MNTASNKTPPALVEWLLSQALPPSRRDEVLGDLQELFLAAPPSRALWVYLWEAAALVAPSILDSLRRCWSPGFGVPGALRAGADVAAVRGQVEQFQQENHCRLVFYLSCVSLLSAYATWRLFHASAWFPCLFWGTFLAMLLFTVVQHHARGSGRTVPAGASLAMLVDFHRRELARRRDFLRTLWYWKMLPLGMPVFAILAVKRDSRVVATVSLMVACYALTTLAARRQARGIERRIDELDAHRTAQPGGVK